MIVTELERQKILNEAGLTKSGLCKDCPLNKEMRVELPGLLHNMKVNVHMAKVRVRCSACPGIPFVRPMIGQETCPRLVRSEVRIRALVPA